FLQGSLFEPLTSAQKYDLVISNPPYIKSEEVGTLMPEVSQWEPHNALDGGLDGLSYYRQIVETAPLYLRENGLLVMELGDECSVGVVDMLECCGYRQIDVFKDFSGTERIIKAKWTR
nr:hypothetical protein [bacterium]